MNKRILTLIVAGFAMMNAGAMNPGMDGEFSTMQFNFPQSAGVVTPVVKSQPAAPKLVVTTPKTVVTSPSVQSKSALSAANIPVEPSRFRVAYTGLAKGFDSARNSVVSTVKANPTTALAVGVVGAALLTYGGYKLGQKMVKARAEAKKVEFEAVYESELEKAFQLNPNPSLPTALLTKEQMTAMGTPAKMTEANAAATTNRQDKSFDAMKAELRAKLSTDKQAYKKAKAEKANAKQAQTPAPVGNPTRWEKVKATFTPKKSVKVVSSPSAAATVAKEVPGQFELDAAQAKKAKTINRLVFGTGLLTVVGLGSYLAYKRNAFGMQSWSLPKFGGNKVVTTK